MISVLKNAGSNKVVGSHFFSFGEHVEVVFSLPSHMQRELGELMNH